MISDKHLAQLIEAAIFSSSTPLSIKKLKEQRLGQYLLAFTITKSGYCL